MWIKECKAKDYVYLNIVKSVKVNKQTKHKVLFNMGRKDLIQQDKQQYLQIAQTIIDYLEGQKIPDTADLYNYGYMLIDNIFNQLKLDKLIKNIKTQTRYDLLSAIKLMVYDRILTPQSKQKTFEHQNKYLDISNVQSQHLYRSLDILHNNKNLIEQHLFQQNHKNINIILYDVTTYAFESTKEDILRKFGYSKDKKFNEVQIVMGLSVADNGIPIGYEIFSGNTCDSKTLKQSIDNLKSKYNTKVTIVADSGINCIDNILEITKQDGYIVAAKIKMFDKETTASMFDNDGYTTINSTYRKEDDIFKYKEITIQKKTKNIEINQRIIFTHSSNRAKKDKKDRERLIEKAKELMLDPNQIKALNKRGGKKYLKEKKNTTWEIDYEKITKDEKYDGYHAVITSENLPVEQILKEYHSLWKIEETFRIMKTTLEARPVYHWTYERILGHFTMCYIALVILRVIESKLSKYNITINELISSLNHMNVAEVKLNCESKYLKINIPEQYNNVLKLLCIAYGKNNKPKKIYIGGEN